jgi:hypothetical protein
MGPMRRNRIGNRLAVVIAAGAIASALAPLAAQADPLVIERPASEARVVQVGNYALWPWACPAGTHYTCWRGSYGGRYCGCWVGGDRPACPTGYYYTCRPDPFGNPYCACY